MRRRDDKFPDNGFEAWGGYMNAKKAKLEEQFSSRAGKEDGLLSDIFSGVSIFVNGYTIPSADELKALMCKHGGVYHTYQRNEDYIIASNLPDTKVKKMSLAKVVRPEWITDSIEASRLLDFRDYLLYKNSITQPKLNFNKVEKNMSLEETKATEFNPVPCNSEKLLQENLSLDILESCNNLDEKAPLLNIDIKSNDSLELCHKGINESDLPNNNVTESSSKVVERKHEIAKTAVDPNFISEFYNNSRLHHISQLGACFKQHVNDLRETSNFVFSARTKLKDQIKSTCNSNNLSQIQFEKGRSIMHIDMDCFFVSVGLRKRPDLRRKPVAVTHSKGGQPRSKRPGVDRSTEFNLYRQKQAKMIGKATGVPEEEIEFESRVDQITDEDDKYGSMSEIASCSYEARAKGVSNGMFMGAALKLCPELQTIPYDFEGYKEVAYTLYNTIAQYTLDIEAVSCDEMYVDCTELLKSIDVSVQDFATVLRNEIKTKTGCPCSTGFGGNRLQARLATKRAKPDGQFFLTAELVEDFMFDIKLRDLPGVGRQTDEKLESIGHQTCGSLQILTLSSLKMHLGNKTGAQLFDQCRGRDPNPLSFHTIRKSVSAEVNYGIRFENNDQCVKFLKQLSAEVHSRMLQFKVVGKCITLKLMVRAKDAPVETAKFLGHGFCDVINKSTSLNSATNDAEVIAKEIISILKNLKIDAKEMRGIGIQITKLESTNSKRTKGAINKFLTNNKSVKTESLADKTVQSNKVELNKVPTTPKKLDKSISPRKKSPVIGLNKSPMGKRRGRPPKSTKVQVSTSNNLMNKFLQGQVTRDTPYKDPMIKDLKQETINDLNKEVKPRINDLNQVTNPSNIIEDQRQGSGLIGLPWKKVRELLRAWLESGQTPLPCDVEMICAYMREMVVNKDIDKLNILLNFLRRRTSELKSQDWIEVYNNVVDQVQNAMLAVYGKRLWLET